MTEVINLFKEAPKALTNFVDDFMQKVTEQFDADQILIVIQKDDKQTCLRYSFKDLHKLIALFHIIDHVLVSEATTVNNDDQ